ncbi:MAG: hypothetical protein E3J72_19810 [Planctomycetota bacterium]|nr:MAG: hypothetical protein E3J72_19810 [Planctomycetota bacterium]
MSGRLLIILFCLGAAALGLVLWRIADISSTSKNERAETENRLARLESNAGLPSPEPDPDEITFDRAVKEAATIRRLSRLSKRVKKNEEDIRALIQRPAVTQSKGNASDTETDLAALLKSVDRKKPDTDEIMFTPEQLKTVRGLLEKMREEDRKRRISNFTNNIKLRMRDEYLKWKDELRLTPEQEREVDEYLDETLKRAVVAWDSYLENGNIEALRKEIREVRKSMDEKAQTVLDPTQIEKLKELDPRGFGARTRDR